MKREELLKKLAYEESIQDLLETERDRLNDLMKIVGFSNGLDTLKNTAEIMIEKGYFQSIV